MHLVDANVLIRAAADYYPLSAVPEYWSWLKHMAVGGFVKMPIEVFEEIKDGPKADPLIVWLKSPGVKDALILKKEVPIAIFQHILHGGYAPDLKESEVEQIGMDPVLIAHAFHSGKTCKVVTAEVSKPKKLRANRKVPDVCDQFGVPWVNPFGFIRDLSFKTSWQKSMPAASAAMPAAPNGHA